MNVQMPTALPITVEEDLTLRTTRGRIARLTPGAALDLAEALIRRGTTKMMLEEAHKLDQDTPGLSDGRRSGRTRHTAGRRG